MIKKASKILALFIILILVVNCNNSEKSNSSKEINSPSISENSSTDTALLIEKLIKTNTGIYPNSIRFVIRLKPRIKADTTIFLYENKININFEPVDNSNSPTPDELWSEMYLSVNYKEIDLYDAPHGPGLNQIGMWMENILNDFNEIIKYKNENYPVKLRTKLLKKYTDNSIKVEIILEITQRPKELKQVVAKYTGMSAGDLVHVFFRTKETNDEMDFWPTSPETTFLINEEAVMKNNYSIIDYVVVKKDLGPTLGWSEPNIMDINYITNIRTNDISISNWWDEVSKDKKKLKKLEEAEEVYIQELWGK